MGREMSPLRKSDADHMNMLWQLTLIHKTSIQMTSSYCRKKRYARSTLQIIIGTDIDYVWPYMQMITNELLQSDATSSAVRLSQLLSTSPLKAFQLEILSYDADNRRNTCLL